MKSWLPPWQRIPPLKQGNHFHMMRWPGSLMNCLPAKLHITALMESLPSLPCLLMNWIKNSINKNTNPEIYSSLVLFYQFVPPMVGASGAIFGVLAAFGMMFPNQMLIMLFPPIPMKAKYFVILYGVIELISGLSNSPHDNVAHFA